MIKSDKFSIFRDDVISATELAQQSEAVLDKALEHPVTITRKDQAFALLKREHMSKITETTDELTKAFEVFYIAYKLQKGVNIGSKHPYEWLAVFDHEELTELIEEVLDTYSCGMETSDWTALKAIIHEWHESAIAIKSQDLASAFSSETEEIPLTAPHLEEFAN